MNCPVQTLAGELVQLTQTAAHTLRRLRREQKTCQACPLTSDCPILQQLNLDFDLALHRLYDEWNLTPTPP